MKKINGQATYPVTLLRRQMGPIAKRLIVTGEYNPQRGEGARPISIELIKPRRCPKVTLLLSQSCQIALLTAARLFLDGALQLLVVEVRNEFANAFLPCWHHRRGVSNGS